MWERLRRKLHNTVGVSSTLHQAGGCAWLSTKVVSRQKSERGQSERGRAPSFASRRKPRLVQEFPKHSREVPRLFFFFVFCFSIVFSTLLFPRLPLFLSSLSLVLSLNMFGLTTLATVAAAALVVPVAAANASAVSAAALALRDSVAGSDDYFIVDFETDVKLDDGSAAVISVNITNSWAPLGAAHFRELVEVRWQ